MTWLKIETVACFAELHLMLDDMKSDGLENEIRIRLSVSLFVWSLVKCVLKCSVHHIWRRTSASLIYERFLN